MNYKLFDGINSWSENIFYQIIWHWFFRRHKISHAINRHCIETAQTDVNSFQLQSCLNMCDLLVVTRH